MQLQKYCFKEIGLVSIDNHIASKNPHLRQRADTTDQYRACIHASASVGNVDHATLGLVFSTTFT